MTKGTVPKSMKEKCNICNESLKAGKVFHMCPICQYYACQSCYKMEKTARCASGDHALYQHLPEDKKKMTYITCGCCGQSKKVNSYWYCRELSYSNPDGPACSDVLCEECHAKRIQGTRMIVVHEGHKFWEADKAYSYSIGEPEEKDPTVLLKILGSIQKSEEGDQRNGHDDGLDRLDKLTQLPSLHEISNVFAMNEVVGNDKKDTTLQLHLPGPMGEAHIFFEAFDAKESTKP